MNKYKIVAGVGLLVFPMTTFAAGKTLRDVIAMIIDYFEVFLVLIISFAVVTFVWNVYKYFFSSDVSGDKKKEAGLYVLYATIGFFVIFSFWGLVAIVRNTFQLEDYRPSWPFGNGGGYSAPASSSGSGFNMGNSRASAEINMGNSRIINTAAPSDNQGSTRGLNISPEQR